MILAKFVKKIDLFLYELRFSKVLHDTEIEKVAVYFLKSGRCSIKFI